MTKDPNYTSTKKIPTVTRLPTRAYKKYFIDHMARMSKEMMRIVAQSIELPETKERLADFFLLMINITDIENERINFEVLIENKLHNAQILKDLLKKEAEESAQSCNQKTEQKKQTRTRRTVSKK